MSYDAALADAKEVGAYWKRSALDWRGQAVKAELAAENYERERDAAHVEVAARMDDLAAAKREAEALLALSARQTHRVLAAERAAKAADLDSWEAHAACRAQIARADAAEAEVTRLRAGEAAEVAPEYTVPTPAQWLRYFNDATPEQRLRLVAAVQGNGETASRCFMEGHVARLADHAARPPLRVSVDVYGPDADLVALVRRAVRVNGGGDVAKAFGE